jgi:CrcB protein
MPRTRHVTPFVGCAVTAVGGALGALARCGLASAFPVTIGHFPWTTFAINVSGSALLAALPLLAVARRHPWLGVLLGTGVLGGFTTMSAASVDTFTLLDHGHLASGTAYCLGTVGAALAGVLLVDRVTTAAERAEAMDEEWDE